MKLPTLPLLAAALVSLSTPPALALTSTFVTALTGAAESPPNASFATGSATVAFDDSLFTVAVQVSFTGLAAPATAAHIHCCTALPLTGTAPPAVTFTGFPALTAGSYSNTFTLAPAAFATLLAGTGAGKAYVNLHDSAFPGGEIRGFLAPVPEPGSYALMALGLTAVGALVRRRRVG